MKTIVIAGLTAWLMLITAPAVACPKGQHPYGGTGSHHKGGWCGP